MITGHASPEGTLAFKQRFESNLHSDHFREKHQLWFSSIGLGSYLGDPDESTDQQYEAAIRTALGSGINVLDTAVNYRAQRSEKVFGKALQSLIEAGEIKREEVIVATKGGFIPFEDEYPADPAAYFKETYLNTGILEPEDLIANCHAMTPKYLEDQLNRSLRNLGLETIDIYYIHNPETQLSQIPRKDFTEKLTAAFKWLEEKVKEGKIRMYGTATWTGYRLSPQDKDYLSLEELDVMAREAGGTEHHFKAIQLPFNMAMPEAWVMPNQPYGGNMLPFLGVVARYDMVVMGSASLLQARLTQGFPEPLKKYFENVSQDAQRFLQFARSVPNITTSLVGMKSVSHVEENLEVAKIPQLSESDLINMLQQR